MNSNNNNKPMPVGAMWIKESKKGNKFVSISLEVMGTKYSFVAFKNNFKEEGSKQPDYKIYPSESPQNTPKSKGFDNEDDLPF
jgi:hypothetical protein